MKSAVPHAPARFTFRAMGIQVELLAERSGPAVEAAFAAVVEEFERLEQIFSRFRPESELSVLNREGRAVVSGELFDVLESALEARESSGGRFDPTVHDALVSCGYDRTFGEVSAHDPGPAGEPVPGGGVVALDRQRRLVELGTRARIDLGGIAKGYAVDRACDLLAETTPCLVNAGGDLAVRGGLAGGPWPVGVEATGESVTLGLGQGALATSGSDYRRWRRGGVEMHHLIDPRTGLPARSDLLRVTAAGTSAVEAEIRTKCLFLAGERAAVEEADDDGIPCVLVTQDGRTVLAGGLA